MESFDFFVEPESYKEGKKMIGLLIELGFKGAYVFEDEKVLNKLKSDFPNFMFFSARELKNLNDNIKGDIVFARSKDIDFNRKIVESGKIDVLLDPYNTSACLFNQVMARLCSKNKIAIGISFNNLTVSSKLTRSNIMKSIMELASIMKKYNVPLKIVSGAVNIWGLRSPSELISLGKLIGFEPHEIKKSLSKNI